MRQLLIEIYNTLFDAFGPRHWWPGETPFEVMVGAILTQNTAWRNVEKAILRLKEEGVLHAEGMRCIRTSQLARLIRSSGTYRIKTERLKAFVHFLFEECGGDLTVMEKEEVPPLRRKLLDIKGIGPETADSILLYGLRKPIFVVDAYTKRILLRHDMISEKASYGEVQSLFMDHLPADEGLFNEYHALLVHLAKHVCQKKPKCNICPLKEIKWEVKNRKWETGNEK